MNYQGTRTILLFLFLTIGLYACGVDVGGNEDKIKPVVALTSLNDGEEVIGTTNITWDNDEQNRSYVDIELSNDSGTTYQIIESNVPDTGTYSLDSNTVDDCRNCRIKITATDVVGNTSDSAESSQDFIINNVPQLLGVAYYTDLNGNGQRNGNSIRVPFDKDLSLLTSIASDIFILPVLGDNIGSFAEVFVSSSDTKELIISMNDFGSSNFNLHVGGTFDPNTLNRTAPSGLNLRSDISSGVIFAPDTGRTASIAAQGIDLLPTFSSDTQILGVNGDNTTLLSLGDVDNDGDLDMVEGRYGLDNQIWINDGTGVFTTGQVPTGTFQTRSIAFGDLDGDGNTDMVEGNTGVNRVWMNDGGGTGAFTDSMQSLGDTSSTYSITLGDVNGNGHLDIVGGNGGTSPDKVWFNDGSGSFTDSGQALGTSTTVSNALGDIDGDGDLDMVAAGTTRHIYFNNGSGVFTDSGQSLGSHSSKSISLGDLDGDGDLDLFDGIYGQNNQIWLNDGNGNFSLAQQQPIGSSHTFNLILGDIDKDGDLDMVEGTTGKSKVWFNDGSANFIDPKVTFGNDVGSVNKVLNLGDIDGDGDLDILIAKYNRPNTVYKNSLRHTNDLFKKTPQVLSTDFSHTNSIALGDVDNDGDIDMVEGNTSQENQVWLNDGKGNFTAGHKDANFYTTISIALGDLDGDGYLDLVEGNASSSANRVWMNDGNGNYTDSGQALGASTTYSIALADLDGDTDLDIFAGNYNQDNQIWLNNGNGVFTAGHKPVGTNNTQAIFLGDVNDDGHIDMVEANLSSANIVWMNDGDGNFSDSGQTLGTTSSHAIALSDLDDDGDMDMIDGKYNDDNQIWLNDGNGNFTSGHQPASAANNNTYTISVGDLDGDGDTDLVMGNQYEDNQIWINDGAGRFTRGQQSTGNTITRTVALADLDGDGDLDLVEGNYYNEHNLVWLNSY